MTAIVEFVFALFTTGLPKGAKKLKTYTRVALYLAGFILGFVFWASSNM